MANDSLDYLNAFSETDCFSTTSKSASCQSDSFAVDDDDHSCQSISKINYQNSKLSSVFPTSFTENSTEHFKNMPGAKLITMNQMLKVHNNNKPWFFNVLKKPFDRRRNLRSNKESTMSIHEYLQTPISTTGTSGKWIVHENDLILPLMKELDLRNDGHYNESRAMSSSISPSTKMSTDDALHLRHYHYDFEPFHVQNELVTMTDANHLTNSLTIISDAPQPLNASTSPSNVDLPADDSHLISDDIIIKTRSARAQSASAAQSARSKHLTTSKRRKDRSISITKKNKKNKYYQERLLSSEEIELREALRLIDIDNLGFFPPSELRQVLQNLGIDGKDIQKIEACLPLDEDGHYSTDNLIKLLLNAT